MWVGREAAPGRGAVAAGEEECGLSGPSGAVGPPRAPLDSASPASARGPALTGRSQSGGGGGEETAREAAALQSFAVVPMSPRGRMRAASQVREKES